MSTLEQFVPSLKLLASIDTTLENFWRTEASDELIRHEQPQGAKLFRRVQVDAQFRRGGLSGTISISDVERARAVLANLQATSLPDIKAAITPLAGLPATYQDADDKVLFILAQITIRAADIRLAQRLVAGEAA